MNIPNPAAQIAPPFTGNPQPRRLGAGDLADLTQSTAKPAVEVAARTQAAPADIRPQRPGSQLDIRV